MKLINEIEVKDKTVILRSDLNVSVRDGDIISDERIKLSLETINYLIDNKAKVILLSHFGKVKDEEDKNKYNNTIIFNRLKHYLNDKVSFCDELEGPVLEKNISKLKSGEVLLLQNTRYMDLNEKKESNCDNDLSEYWASLGDIFINDAYGMMHRRHASNYGIANYIKSGYGFLVEKEINKLKILEENIKPYTIFMGGAKVDKIKHMNNLLSKCDYLLLGGIILNTFLKVNYNIADSLYGEDYVEEAKTLLLKYKDKIIFPNKVIVLNNNKVYKRKLNNIKDGDIIYDVEVKSYFKYLNKSKIIFVNGTPGYYECKNFENGTRNLLKFLSKQKAKVIIGGGDALSSAHYFNINNFYFKSTGGGATLSYASSLKHNALIKEVKK